MGILLWKQNIPMRRACVLTLTDEDKATLERWSRSRSSEARLVERAQIILLAADGRENKDIAVELGITRATVSRWRNRFAEGGSPGSRKTHLGEAALPRHATNSSGRSSR